MLCRRIFLYYYFFLNKQILLWWTLLIVQEFQKSTMSTLNCEYENWVKSFNHCWLKFWSVCDRWWIMFLILYTYKSEFKKMKEKSNIRNNKISPLYYNYYSWIPGKPKKKNRKGYSRSSTFSSIRRSRIAYQGGWIALTAASYI